MRHDTPDGRAYYTAMEKAVRDAKEGPSLVIEIAGDDQDSPLPHRVERRAFTYKEAAELGAACGECRWFKEPDTCGLFRCLGAKLPDTFALQDKTPPEAGCAAFEARETGEVATGA